jgi:hypothetical protein
VIERINDVQKCSEHDPEYIVIRDDKSQTLLQFDLILCTSRAEVRSFKEFDQISARHLT